MKTEILIVEDEGLIALDLKTKLEQRGYIVSAIADNGPDALQAVERLRPALVMMDIRLRGAQDGIELADRIRRGWHVPVMFVTAHADRETLERARITEPFGYIVKPFHSVDFRAQIEIALWKHQMEQKLRASEAWLSTTFRNVADGLIATDSQGNIEFINRPAEALTGWELSEAKGKPFLDIFQVFDESDLPVVHPLDTIYDGRELDISARVYKLKARDSADFIYIEAQLSANRDDDSLLGIIVVFRDITQRRKAEEQNRLLQKMNALALMAVGLGRQLSESQRGMDSSIQELVSVSQGHAVSLLADIYERSAHQQSIVQQLIRLGRTDPGQVVALNLNDVLTDLKPKFKKVLGFGSVLNFRLQAALPAIKADPQELRDNLIRLVADARGAMPDGGTVEISTSVTASELNTPVASASGVTVAGKDRLVQLRISDSGRGLRPGAKERVFDPYYQSRPGNRNPGFSLALVYQFVAVSGGHIDVESAPGEGTAYLLSFPAAENSRALRLSAKRVAATA
jgi:PAS domain S-box-containing protein